MGLRARLYSSTMLAGAAMLSGPAVAADMMLTKAPLAQQPVVLPAVDGVNTKVEGLGGVLSDRTLYGAKGAVTFPLAQQYGAQIDAEAGSLDGQAYGAIGGHLFWRDPSRGLVGLYTNHTWWNDLGGAYVGRLAGEGEYYWDRFTIQGIAGVEFGNNTSVSSYSSFIAVPPTFTPGILTTAYGIEGYDIKTRFFDEVNLKYYFTDNWDGYVGHRYLGGKNQFAVGTEYAFYTLGGQQISAFVEGRVGEDDSNGVWGGLKFYFGQPNKTLIQRHRQGDPNLWDSLFSILNNHFQNGAAVNTPFCNTPDGDGECLGADGDGDGPS